MKYFKYLFLILFIFYFNSVNAQYSELNIKITKNLRCLICQGQSVHDSDSEFANSVKILVEKKLDQGLDEEQIYNYLKNKYGEWILYDPNFNKKTYFLWLLPLLFFIMGGVVILKIFILKKN
tara:strand:+ start:154 stop:519 length:366 start_codon:yes stop_codon:yes gene_type:complete